MDAVRISFPPGHEQEGLQIFTEFTADVRSLLILRRKNAATASAWGARAVTAANGRRDGNGPSYVGAAWFREYERGHPVFLSTEPDMPIELWRQLLKGTGVILAAGMEILVRPDRAFAIVRNSLATARGAAGILLDRGADRNYLLNYF